MNRFSFLLRYDPAGQLAPERDADYSDGHLLLRSENLHPGLRLYERSSRLVGLLGNPIAQGRRDDEAVLTALDLAPSEAEFLRALNGSFLVLLYEPASGRLTIANDRFASLAFYFAMEGRDLLGALSLKQLIDARGSHRIDPEAAFEFLYFRRLFGEKTLVPGITYLTSASLLRVAPNRPKPEVEKYWQPDYARLRPRGRHLVDALAEGLRAAVAMNCSDPRNYALLLSGGLDSRAILAAANPPPFCVTTALSRNNEVEVAAEVAAAAGAAHRFIERPAALYDPVLDDAVFLTGGMQVYSEAQFMGYGPQLAGDAHTLLIGLGLDIFFGGLYLPKEPARILGRQALHHRLLPFSDDLAGDFIRGVKYRLRTSAPFSIVKAPMRSRLMESLRESVTEILERGRALGAEGYDLWEYMHLHNLSRHYSFPMMASVKTFADCRAPALENELFDLAIAMRAEDKLDGTPYQNAITRLNPAVMAVRNANTNLKAAYPLRTQTWIKALAMAGNRILGTRYPVSPGWQERSWPSPKATLEANPRIFERIRGLPCSEALAELGFLEMGGIKGLVAEHDSGRHDHAVLLNLLLTIDRFVAAAPAEQDLPIAASQNSA